MDGFLKYKTLLYVSSLICSLIKGVGARLPIKSGNRLLYVHTFTNSFIQLVADAFCQQNWKAFYRFGKHYTDWLILHKGIQGF